MLRRSGRGGDLATGEGLDEAVRDVDVIVHAATDPANASAIDMEGTSYLASAARSAGVGHLVYVSIVGVDRIPLAYYRTKVAAEEVVRSSGVPWSILRVTQFHSFVDMLLARAARYPLVLLVPWRFRVQSISVDDAAEVLLDVAGGEPAGRAPDLAGPEVLEVAGAARAWIRARRLRKLVAPVPVPGAAARALRAGHNTVPGRPGGRETWSAWLARPRTDAASAR